MAFLKFNKNWLAVLVLSTASMVAVTPADAAKPKRHSTTSASKSVKSSSAKARVRKATAKRGGIVRASYRPSRTAARALPAVPLPETAAVSVKPIPRGAAASLSAASGASFGQLYGLHQTRDPLALKSSVALVLDQDTDEVLLAKNSDAVLPIASLTKLMTAMVIVESRLPMDEPIAITSDDVDTEKNSSSRLAVGAVLTRGELLHLALMSSENRAAHALGRTYPGGLSTFVALMNRKAQALGMTDTRYVEPTGLSSQNQASARDLATLVKAAYQQSLIRELSTSPEHAVHVGSRQIQFRNTNGLVRNPSWDIGLQKTGYIVEAGRCLVMQARLAGRKLIMVFLDSSGKFSRQADAERVRRWIESAPQAGAPAGINATAAPKVTS